MANMVLRATYLGDEREHSGALYPINTPLPAPGPVQPNRPYQPFGSINVFENGETSNTQQLQLAAERRFSSGLSFGIQYSWTKTLDGSLYDQSLPTVPNNIRLDRGNDPMIRQQYVIANYVYQVPFGRGRRFGSSMPKVVDAVLGGWETSGIVTLASGLPFSVTFDSSVQGWPSSRANIVGNPGVAHPSLTQWFNPAAYAVPAPFFYGNSAPNSLFGPGFSNWDTAAMKNFAVWERLNLQFRAEFFNALNHPNFANPNSDISVASRVGTITSTTGSPRVVQFALRLEF